MLLFTKDFTQQEPLPEQSVQNALAALATGRLHRYNVAKGVLTKYRWRVVKG